jgi:hypothetical protein
MTQRTLSLTLSQRTALVTVDTARAVRGVDAESVLDEIEDGRIPWVWDIASLGSERRELRIWAEGLRSAECGVRSAEDVIAEIIGTTRPTLRGSEVERLLLCSAQLVKQLHEAGELRGALVGHTRHLRRDSLAEFLRRRRVA